MPESINSKLKEQYDHDDSGGSLDTNLGDFLDSEGASGTSNNSKWRDWASGTGTSLNTRLFHKHGGSGSFMTRWKNWIAFSSTHSFNFDGSNDYLELPITSALNITGAMTVSGWFKVSSQSTAQFIICKDDTSNRVFNVAVLESSSGNANKLIFNIYNGGSATSVLTAGTVTDNNWHHFAGVFVPSTSLTLYIDGTASTNTTSIPSSIDMSTDEGNTPIRIGNHEGNALYTNGLIDEVAIWDTALSASDVTSIYNNGKVIDLSKSASYGTDRTGNLKLWLRCGDKAEPESTTAIARQDFYTDFDGTDDYVDCGSDSSVDDIWTGGGTITGWINSHSIGENTGFYVVKRGSDSGWHISNKDESGDTCKLRFAVRWDNFGQWTTTSRDITYNEWIHIAVSYDNGSTSNNPTIYINGVSVAVTTVTAPSGTYESDASDTLYIGGEAGDFTTDGAISNIALHQTILDAQTISQMAKSRFTPMRDNRFSVVDFDGSNDLIDLPATYGSDNISISTWVNYVDDGATGNIFDTRDAVSDGYVLQVNSSNQVAFKVNGTTNTYTGATFANQWVHIVGTYNGTQIKIYINGELVNTSNLTSTVSTTTNAKIGRRNYNTAEPFQGSISSVAVYNVTKSAEEIYAIYQQGITYDESSLSGLQGYWRMGDDTSKAYPIIADSSSNSNDGTITNGASDDIVQQMSAGYDLGAFESSSEELGGEISPSLETANWTLSSSGDIHRISNGYWEYDDGNNRNITTSSEYIQKAGIYKLAFDLSEHLGATVSAKLRLRIGASDVGNPSGALPSDIWGTGDKTSDNLNSGSHTFYFEIPSDLSSTSTIRLDARNIGSAFKLNNLSLKACPTIRSIRHFSCHHRCK